MDTEWNEDDVELLRKIFSAATYLFVNQGIVRTSLKQIAERADISSEVIHRFFSTKENIVIGFYEFSAFLALHEYSHTDGLESYSEIERLQLLIDLLLEQFAAEREFVELTFKSIIKKSLPPCSKNKSPIAKLYQPEFENIINEAINKDIYASLLTSHRISELMIFHCYSVIFYWIKDESHNAKNTTKYVELSLSLLDSKLRSRVPDAMMDLAKFLLKPTLLRATESFDCIFDVVRSLRDRFSSKSPASFRE